MEFQIVNDGRVKSQLDFKKFVNKIIEIIVIHHIEILMPFLLLLVVVYLEHFKNFITTTLQIWQFIIIVLIFLILYYALKFYKSKYIHKILKYGVEWHIVIKKNKVVSIEGPFCPRCQFEMTESLPFHCLICDKKYPGLNINDIDSTKKNIEKIIEAELRSGKILIMDWYTSTYHYPESDFYVTNNGVSTIKNISVNINLKINDLERDIGIYKFEKIESDKREKIGKSDPMKKIHKILEELKLIKLFHEDMGPTIEEDKYGIPHSIPLFHEWREIKNEFSCYLDIKLIYYLRRKKKTEQNKYFLEFKYNERPPWEIDMHEGNCEIHIVQVE